ncbi:MAG: histidine--tRNA ligase [Myxococcota bacterium]
MSTAKEPIRAVKGTHDLYEDELVTWRWVENTARHMFARFGYGELRTPVLEETQLFVRGVGEGTDIVEKEMYAFRDKDKAETSLCLRPENTAGVVRALIQAGRLFADAEERLYYLGPMFRRERPAKGRYRQFHQLGVEVFGLDGPTIDVEVMGLLHALLQALGLEGVELRVNSLGGPEDRARHRQALYAYFTPLRDQLCSDCQRRLETNVLRILDCKVPEDKALAAGAPSTLSHLGADAMTHFESVQRGLADLGVTFTVDPSLVRGLDYYTGTVFEAVATTGLGAQNAVAGGGRYDLLVEELGGRPTPAIGFAAGIERIVMLLVEAGRAAKPSPPLLMLVGADDVGRREAHRLAHALRLAGAAVEVDHRGRSVKAQMKRADRAAVSHVIVLGQREIEGKTAQVKEMSTGAVREVSLEPAALLTGLGTGNQPS